MPQTTGQGSRYLHSDAEDACGQLTAHERHIGGRGIEDAPASGKLAFMVDEVRIAPTWAETIAELNELEDQFAPHLARLLSELLPQWESEVVATRCLLMYPPGLGLRFESRSNRSGAAVLASWADDIFEMRLVSDKNLLVTADRCRIETAPSVLESFLMQLGTDP